MHGWTRFPVYKKGRVANKRNLAATKTTSAQCSHVDVGAELSVVCVVRLRASWELLLPLTASLLPLCTL